ncbi:MAG: hypothetical protein VXW32_13320 [Myxococcota bacterium]|nr:hypothetical protein [Myxococcota bacterium]
MKRIVCLSSIALLAACDTANVQEDAEVGRIGGYVTDLDGNPVEGVKIEAQGLTALSGADGLYYIEGVSPSESILVTFKKRGYAKSYQATSIISWETVGVDGTLMEIDGFGTIESAMGGRIEVGEVSIDFDPSAVIQADGSPYSGEVTVEVTHLDPHTEMAGAPGDLSALSFSLAGDGTSKNDFASAQLVSYGMLDVTLFSEEGDELNIDESSPVDISMPISNGELASVYHLASGDTQQTWSFNPEQMRWIEEGEGTVMADEETGELSFNFQATHFSWWNCDQGMVPTCASGRVIDMLGFPVRGAKVSCVGGSSTSVVTTDENGYYVCSVLAGDTVQFVGETFVANSWNWDKNVPVKFIDGEGSSSATCEPIETIEIEVCRETGVVSVQNVEAVTETDAVGGVQQLNSDGVAGFFWEPPGFPEYCDNPWEKIGLDNCINFDTQDAASHFPNLSNHGMPTDGRSVGSYLEVSTGTKDYRMMRDQTGNTPYYAWDNEEVGSAGITDSSAEFESNDVLHVFAPGDASDYAGVWDEPYFATVPQQTRMDNQAFMENTGQTMNLSYEGADGGDVLVMASSMSDGSSESMICRMNDDGNIRIPGSAMDQMDRGWAGLGIYNADTGWAVGPDGLPVRLQVFSGSSTVVNMQ